jgi:hypothetical protein
MSWLPSRQLVVAEPVYTAGAGPVAQLRILDGTRLIDIRTVMSDPAGLRSAPLSIAVNRAGSAMMAAEGDSLDGRVVVYDGAGQLRANVTGHDGNVQFVRDGTAIAYHDLRSPRETSLRVVSLVGETLSPSFQDHVVFDQGIVVAAGQGGFAGAAEADAPRYRGDDVPTGRALWDMAMEEVGAEARDEIAVDRIEVP